MKKTKSKIRRTSQESDAAGGLIVLIIIVGAIYWFFFRDKSPVLPETVQQQIKEIDNIERNLENLLDFLDRQQDRLKNQEKILAQLRSEHKSLRPIVEADRKVVSAILAEEAKRQRRHIWIDRFVVFSLGVASSIVANLVWSRIRRRRKAMENPPDRN